MPTVSVFKFGGASVKDARSVANVKAILEKYNADKIAVVVSAMGKTTNAFEKVWKSINEKNRIQAGEELKQIEDFHLAIVEELFPENALKIKIAIQKILEIPKDAIEGKINGKPDYIYDQIVSCGELLSSTIVSHYLNANDTSNQWFDARTIIKTDYHFRSAHVDWPKTQLQVEQTLQSFFQLGDSKIAVTQGFIGGADSLNTTTLGREGSDYSAAILAFALNANQVLIWKDVPGVLNADPKFFPEAEKLDEISYKEAIELAYYGASVIHPKTLQPLQNKKIPLWVKSFKSPEEKGTLIHENTAFDSSRPSFIIKHNQRLISLATKDFSFIVEEHLSEIFHLFAQHKVTINMMQNSAINFSVSVDDDLLRLNALVEELSGKYTIRFNTGLDLLTIRHYDKPTRKKLTANKSILMEQRTRNTYRVVLKEESN